MNMKKYPSSIQSWDSNPQPLEYESPPITTRQGLLSFIGYFLNGPIPASFSVHFCLFNIIQFKFKFKLIKA